MMVEGNCHSILESGFDDGLFQGADNFTGVNLVALCDVVFFSLTASDIRFDIAHLDDVFRHFSSYFVFLQLFHFSSLPACISILLALLIIG